MQWSGTPGVEKLRSPAGTRGVDEGSAVEVVLADDGLPALLRPLGGWPRAAAADRLGTAVREAFATAHRAYTAATAEEFERALRLRSATAPAARSGRAPVSPAQVLDLAERVLGLAKRVAAGSTRPTGVGRCADAPVTVTLGLPAAVRCEIDGRWAASVRPAVAERALAEALGAARSACAAVAGERPEAELAGLAAAMIEQIAALRLATVESGIRAVMADDGGR